MNNNYEILSESVRQRSNPEQLVTEKSFSDELRTILYSKVLVYVRLAMRGVEPEYTKISKLAGERVKEHLSKTMSNVEFRYQGSVMTNTHIRSYSDVDLLTISDEFYTYDAYQSSRILNESNLKGNYYPTQLNKLREEVENTPYGKDSLQVLRNLRIDAESKLSAVYSICNTNKPKSIKITNTNLRRDVDIVIANWYDDVLSIINGKGEYRGIQIYNKDTHSKENADYPFMSIDRINERGSRTAGRVKKMIRFLKNLKAKSTHDITLSSFDFNAICYDINVTEYESAVFYQLVFVLYRQLRNILDSQIYADRVMSVDGREHIFRSKPEKLEQVRLLLGELEGVYNDLVREGIS